MNAKNPNASPKAPNYRLRRVGVAAGLAAVIGAGISIGEAVSGDDSKKAPAVPTEVRDYVTQPGDTEFSIASRAFPNKDPRETEKIVDDAADKAAGADIKPGNLPPFLQLELPADSAIGTLVTPQPQTTETISPEQRGGTVRPAPTTTH